jgi:hypothetical protein
MSSLPARSARRTASTRQDEELFTQLFSAPVKENGFGRLLKK